MIISNFEVNLQVAVTVGEVNSRVTVVELSLV